jgi:hypothetical protein
VPGCLKTSSSTPVFFFFRYTAMWSRNTLQHARQYCQWNIIMENEILKLK